MSDTQLEQFMRRLASVVADDGVPTAVVTCDSAKSFRLAGLFDGTPVPVVDVGVAEVLALTTAAGMAQAGVRVFVAGFANFLTLRGAEVLCSLIRSARADVTVLGGMAGLSPGRDGVMHHATDDLALLLDQPGFRVLAPSDWTSVEHCVADVVAAGGPAYVRLVRRAVPDLAGGPVPASGLRRLRPGGGGVVVCGYGAQVPHLLAAVDATGEPIGVVEVARLAPLDEPALRTELSGARTVLVVEEHAGGGLADRVARLLSGGGAAVRGIGVPSPAPGSGDYDELLSRCGLAGPALTTALAGELGG